MSFLLFVQFVHSEIPASHLVITVRDALPKNLLVQLFQAGGLRYRDHVIAPCIADQSFNAAFLIAAVGIAKTGFKAVVSLELAESRLLYAITTSQHLLHRCR